MTAEEIFTAALERGTAQARSSFLDLVCGRDNRLRREVDGLLWAHESAGSFLERPVVPAWDEEGTGAQVGASAPLGVGAAVGPYALVRVLGEGGMGTVYEAEQTSPVRRRVALKVARWDAGAAARTRFEAERLAAARMDHPGVARVLDAGTTPDGRAWFAMELCPGRPISSWCDERRLTVRERVGLVLEVCRAVQHAHQKGVVHRDLKPDNVLVAEQDGRAVVKVIDFGVAKTVGAEPTDATGHTQYGQVLGTLRYMAPEQAAADGGDVDTRADVYGLGAVLYELLTGSAPLDEDVATGRGLLSALARVKEAEPPAPSVRVAAAPDRAALALRRGTTPRGLVSQVRGELDWIVTRCLEKDRDRRYPTADALARDLERHLAGRAVSVGPPSAWYRTRKALRRHRTAAAVTGLSLAFLVAGGVGLGWVLRERTSRRAATASEVARALAGADRAQEAGIWDAALAAAQRAEALLAPAEGLDELRARTVRRREDLEFAVRVDEIRLRAASDLDFTSLAPALAEAFRGLGCDVERLSPPDAASRLRARSVPLVAAVALDLWAVARAAADRGSGSHAWRTYVEVAKALDDDPIRTRLRDMQLRGDFAAMAAALTPDTVASLPPSAANHFVVAIRSYGFAREALEACRAAQLAHPSDFYLNLELGTQLFESGNLDDAARFLTAAVALRPTSSAAHQNLGAVWGEQGRTGDAKVSARRAVDLAPSEPAPRLSLAMLQRRMKSLDEALATARAALDLDRNYARSWALVSSIHFDRREYPACIEAATEALRLQPDDAETCLLLAKAHGRSGATDAAVAAYRETIRIDPRLPRAKYLLAFNLWKRGDREEAIAVGREAVLVEPTFAPAQYQLGIHLTAVGDHDRAIAAYRAAVAIDAGYAEAHCNLGHLLLRRREFDAALAALRRGHDLGSKRDGWNYPSAQWIADAEFAGRAARLFDGFTGSSPDAARAAFHELVAGAGVSDPARNDALFEGAAAAVAASTGCAPELAGAWRRLAQEWLTLDLESWPDTPPGSDVARASSIAGALALWESSPRIASVRGDAVDGLPEDEREAWRTLWAEFARRRDAAAAAAPGR